MKCYYKLYLSEDLISEKEKLIQKLNADEFQIGKYIVALTKSKHHLEIYHSILLIQKSISKNNVLVVGIANRYEDAIKLVEKITQEVYDKTKGTDIKRYIFEMQQEFEEGNV